MNPRRTTGRWLARAAPAALLLGLPLAAFFAAPAARAATGGTGTPASQLAGINSSADASALQILPYTPGVVGAGNVATGNFFQVSLPYASSTASTGPTTSGTAAPLWPGPTAAEAGNALSTFGFPPELAALLNDPAVARSTYPPQLTTPASSSYQPPGGSTTGAGDASTDSGPTGTASKAQLSDTSLLPGAALVEIASSEVSSDAQLKPSSVTTTARSRVGKVSLLGGEVEIDGVSSTATASSDGSRGGGTTDLEIGKVTVAGTTASIGPEGIQLSNGAGQPSNPLPQLGGAAPTANQVLAALRQAGLSVTTVAATRQVSGGSATLTSGAVRILFQDPNVPNPQGQLPVGRSVGLEIDLALSEASADATLPPSFGFPGFGGAAFRGGLPQTGQSGLAAAPPSPAVSGGATTYAPPSSRYVPGTPGTPGSPASGITARASPAGFLGLPVRAVWVALAAILAVVTSGPLLAYARWQLLRGRPR